MNFLQWNANGILNKKMELKDFLQRRDVHVALIQETKLQASSKTPTFPGYTSLRRDRTGGAGGGLLTLISKNVPFTNITEQIIATLPQDTTLEIQSIKIRVGNKDYVLHNIYIPPTSSCPQGYRPNIGILAQNGTIITGDFNAHDSTWLSSQREDPRGALLLEQLEPMVVMNNSDTPTRKPFSSATRPTSPDITFCSPDISLFTEWSTTPELSSDHLPLIIKVRISKPIQPKPKHTFQNYKKADWPAFAREVEEAMQNYDVRSFRSIDAAAGELSRAINRASKRHIPAGYVRGYTPLFTPEIRSLKQQRKHLRSMPPTAENCERLAGLNEIIATKIKEHQDALWKDTIENVNHRTTPTKLWRLVKSLHSNLSPPPKPTKQ